jgi:hypothetical protein
MKILVNYIWVKKFNLNKGVSKLNQASEIRDQFRANKSIWVDVN